MALVISMRAYVHMDENNPTHAQNHSVIYSEKKNKPSFCGDMFNQTGSKKSLSQGFIRENLNNGSLGLDIGH